MRREAIGIGVVGYGRVASRWQVPVHLRAGLKVMAICDRAEEALRRAAVDWPAIRQYQSYDELLADPAVHVVDLATRPPGRLALISQAIDAGRHVLAQKPLAFATDGMAELCDRAGRAGVVVAVNQNGRFAPAWRRATDLLQDGVVGKIRAITHLYDTMLRWKPDMARHGTRQFLLFDYSNHWIDITGYWLRPDPVVAVQAMDYESVRHRDGSVQQSMWISMETESGERMTGWGFHEIEFAYAPSEPGPESYTTRGPGCSIRTTRHAATEAAASITIATRRSTAHGTRSTCGPSTG